jgi:hypothetical protein
MNPTFDNLGESQNRAQPASDDQDALSQFQCPVCRARQPLQNECRRCRADLSLVVSIHLRIDYLREQLKQAAKGSLRREQLIKELRLLG